MVKFRILLLSIFLFNCPDACPQKFSAFVNAGEKEMRRGDYYSATLYFQKALDFETEDVKLRYNMAEASRLFNDYYPASYWYNQVVLTDKEGRFPLALYWLAMMNKMQGEYEPAKNLFFRYYTLHQPDSDYFSLRAGREIQACEDAYQAMQDTLPVTIRNLGSNVNTAYSDFGAFQPADSVLYYSSLRFELDDPETNKAERFVTRILKSGNRNGKFGYPEPLDTLFNTDTLHNGNSAFSSDFRVMVFARCTPVTYSDLRCDLFMSRRDKGGWSVPVRLNDSINLSGYTATQPCIGNRGGAGYTLYFVSDRPGGFGKLDIYKADFTTDGVFSAPQNLGPVINTDENEVTPFFHNSTQTLYFSSDRVSGLGGYDVFRSVFSVDSFGIPEHEGYPVNTSYHDLYFTQSESAEKGLLSSNRPGSLYIKSKTCCYDIYAWQSEKPPPADTAVMPAIKEIMKPIVVARQLLPLELYFHNDEPDPRTTKTVTNKDYKELYEAYMAMRPEYETNYAAGLRGPEAHAAHAAIGKLFEDKIKASYERLDRFAGLLLLELRDGKKVNITVRGQASPLALPDYNVNLSKRRISSFLNYLLQYEQGAIRKFLDSGALAIEEVGAGESLARETVSDDLSDRRNSVYSPSAALERKIEVIDVKSEVVE